MAKNKKKDPPIALEQFARMLRRYASTIDAHFVIMGETHGDRELDLARTCAVAALEKIPRGEDPSHLVGFVQGVLLCKGIHTWEYLASDDRRE